jgi:hypothetical protein
MKVKWLDDFYFLMFSHFVINFTMLLGSVASPTYQFYHFQAHS